MLYREMNSSLAIIRLASDIRRRMILALIEADTKINGERVEQAAQSADAEESKGKTNSRQR